MYRTYSLRGKRQSVTDIYHTFEPVQLYHIDTFIKQRRYHLSMSPAKQPAMFRTTLPYAPSILSGNDESDPTHIMMLICNIMIGPGVELFLSPTTGT